MSEKSGAAPHPIPDVPQNLAVEAPVVKTPMEGESYPTPVAFKGTGRPGWWVYFTRTPTDGSNLGSAIVEVDGSWEFRASLNPGEVAVFGWQQNNRERSPWTPVIKFTVK